jgi:ribosome recycling factor
VQVTKIIINKWLYVFFLFFLNTVFKNFFYCKFYIKKIQAHFLLIRQKELILKQPEKFLDMNEELKFIYDHAEEHMQKAIEHLEHELKSIRAGKASPQMLSTVTVDYYGTQTPLSQVANVGIRDAQTLTIQPWEKNMLSVIERAIINANLGFAPNNNGEMIIINIPPLTEERRKELFKQAKEEAEISKVSIRNIRKDANHEIKKLEKNKEISEDESKIAHEEIQELTDKFIAEVEKHLEKKEKDIMTV